MASTRNLQQTILWCGAFVKYLPLLQGSQEPALSSANLVLQTILGPPFCWRWNRNTASFNCVVTTPPTQDYTAFISDFGFIEKAWLKNPDNSDLKEIQVENTLGGSYEVGRPGRIAAQNDDNGNNITFRMMQTPDKPYPVTVLYQRKAVPLTSIVNTWAPIPDEMEYIYDWGFLALMAILNDDPRFPIYNQKFISHLLGAQGGLDDMKRNIFLGNWLEITRQAMTVQAKAQQAVGARGQ